jgi:hypothetical protein
VRCETRAGARIGVEAGTQKPSAPPLVAHAGVTEPSPLVSALAIHVSPVAEDVTVRPSALLVKPGWMPVTSASCVYGGRWGFGRHAAGLSLGLGLGAWASTLLLWANPAAGPFSRAVQQRPLTGRTPCLPAPTWPVKPLAPQSTAAFAS